MEVAEKIVDFANDYLKEAAAEQEADARQAQIMTALGNIQQTLNSLQDEQQQSTNIAMIGGSFTSIETWQTRYATANKFKNTSEINTLINEFNENAPTYITNIFNVLNGQGLGPGTSPLLKSWHDASYKKMYTPVNGQYTFTLKNYLDDYNSIVSWGISMAGYALMCQIIALRVLAAPTMSASDLQGEADQYTSQFTANATAALGVAYDQFPSFVKKFKPNYTDVGTNLNQWFRMWLPGQHVKNYVGWTGDGINAENDQNYGVNGYSQNFMYQLSPLDCNDDEGIYPAVEFRFDEATHPMNGLATLISRVDGAGVFIYKFDEGGLNSVGLTTTLDPQYWAEGGTFTQALFNILPVSAKDMGNNPAPGFVLMLANGPPDKVADWTWVPGTASPLLYWILRDDGLDQSSWVQTPTSASTAPGDDSDAPSPNPSV
ncbi:uncharacterized protein FSUBG_10933 [Fusarium subglutinans]|uniref:Uncharacterized protein n=1 Tax=Gibberella subglutinans TaxID=42677 RepID=A0A8H5P6G1_GIBSU|nr:uncharacterized protein FSUBG_10933 [Fusarium subglutinans]KAF5590095.1 hypothetical protein FSUBG_10933 [Fusarium subglutinans]